MHPGQPLTTSGLSESRPSSAGTSLSCPGSVAFGPTWETGRVTEQPTPQMPPQLEEAFCLMNPGPPARILQPDRGVGVCLFSLNGICCTPEEPTPFHLRPQRG
ncbi:unnamed protein product [Rangifer tarandus platyrhynchus]|uniref:Uncharacterized protein n=1 Tax=Rangifer tarandus platyrhynchus TaxID=3082113 RepID=A0AC59ZGZ0_RANTA